MNNYNRQYKKEHENGKVCTKIHSLQKGQFLGGYNIFYKVKFIYFIL